MTAQRRGILTLDTDLLSAVLGLPPGSKIRGVAAEGAWRDEVSLFIGEEAWRGTVSFVIDHPALPETPEGDPYPHLDLVRSRTGWKVIG